MKQFDLFSFAIPILSGGFLAFFSLLFLKRIAPKIDLLDLPNERKQHKGSVPLVGGLAILIGFIFTCLIIPLPLSPYKPLLGCMTLIVFLGFADDLHELTPRLRLMGQMLIILVAIFWGNVALKNLGNLFFSGDIHLSIIGGTIFTILAWLSFMNASNMQDGVDGLAGTVTFIQILVLLLLAILANSDADIALLTTFAACLFVFLCFNFPLPKNNRPAKVFMGDAGSLLLGFFTAWFAIHFSQQTHFPTPVTFLWITAVPLLDFFGVTIGRLLKRRSPMKGDREHFHHFLQNKGYQPFQIVVCLAFCSLLFSGIGLTLFWTGVSDGISFFSFLFILLLYVVASRQFFR